MSLSFERKIIGTKDQINLSIRNTISNQEIRYHVTKKLAWVADDIIKSHREEVRKDIQKRNTEFQAVKKEKNKPSLVDKIHGRIIQFVYTLYLRQMR